ncbi:hypothetical protein [Undibacterium crateris]|uniref:hypothetical protein n=1 Tax=Undibacterium crateris TaxID=2528175 RepID=UPI00138A1B2E|nr:hypothetical protein [Undibacterium crateris]NDI84617.1 hypothetical protein [Undibacterium crateris]
MKKKFISMVQFKVIFVVFILCCMLIHQQFAHSQALPMTRAANFVMNRAVAGIVANRIAVAEGAAANDAVWLAKAANDPIYSATMAGISRQMTGLNIASAIAGGALAIAGAPVWMTIAASLAITTLGALYFANTAAVSPGVPTANVKITADGKVSIQNAAPNTNISSYAPPASVPSTSPFNDAYVNAASAGMLVFKTAQCYATDSWCNLFPAFPAGITASSFPFYTAGGSVVVVGKQLSDVDKFNGIWVSTINAATPPHTDGFPVIYLGAAWQQPSVPGQQARLVQSSMSTHWTNNNGVWTSTTTAPVVNASNMLGDPRYAPQTFNNLSDAVANMTDDTLKMPLSADQLAAVANAAWQQAASDPNYHGQPYSASQPITAADVATWQQNQKNQLPTLGDMLTPASSPGTQTVPVSPTVTIVVPVPTPTPPPVPAIGTNVNVMNTPTVMVGNPVKVDMGADPGVADPSLEQTPDAASILSPLISLLPELRSFQTPGHSADCPKPTFTVFGKSFVMDSHCTIAEQNRAALGAIMLVVWLIVGLFILLSA